MLPLGQAGNQGRERQREAFFNNQNLKNYIFPGVGRHSQHSQEGPGGLWDLLDCLKTKQNKSFGCIWHPRGPTTVTIGDPTPFPLCSPVAWCTLVLAHLWLGVPSAASAGSTGGRKVSYLWGSAF